MTGDLFTHLSQRALGEAPTVQPNLASRFDYRSPQEIEVTDEPAENGFDERVPTPEAAETDVHIREREPVAPIPKDQIQPSDRPALFPQQHLKPTGTKSTGLENTKTSAGQHQKAPDPLIQNPPKKPVSEDFAVHTYEPPPLVASKKNQRDFEAARQQPELKEILPHPVGRRRAGVKKKRSGEVGQRISNAYATPQPNRFQRDSKGSKERSAAAPPTIRVSIGRIEVRAVTAPSPVQRRPAQKRTGPALSLETYLKQRNEGRR